MNLPMNVDPSDVGVANLQHYQDVYQQLTRCPEKRVTYKQARHRVGLEHIISLHKEIERTANTMEVISSSTNVTQRLDDDSHERWSGMEKFRIHGPDIPNVTTDVELVYNFLIKLPYADNPGAYKITVGLRNELCSLQKHRNAGEDFDEFEFLMMSRMSTARWEVEFTDMSVARTFGRAISSWYDALPKHPEPFAERVSKFAKMYVSGVVRLISACIIAVATFGKAVWTFEPINSGKIAVFILLMYAAHFLTTPLIERLQRKLMCIRTAASLSITQPDKDLLDDEEAARGKLARWVWVNALLPQLPAAAIGAVTWLRPYFY